MRRLTRTVSRLAYAALLFAFCSCAPQKIASDGRWWSQPYKPASTDVHIQRTSQYLTMRDGVRIAADVYLPENLKSGEQLPTILVQTRYYRAFKLRWPLSALMNRLGAISQTFTANRYAIVMIDTRGSGASFGSISSPWSPDEVRDGGEVLDWIVRQPWSNGKVGATGVSYDGTAAEMLMVNKHPALKAVIPRFSLFDCYTDIAFPGGIHNSWFTKAWGDGNKALDSGRPAALGGLFQKIFVLGVEPVDEDTDELLVSQAIREHAGNHDVESDALHLTYRDDRTPRNVSFDEFCPDGHVAELSASNIPVLSYSGWFDGAYANAAIKRFLTIQSTGNKLILGPWDHGGRQAISPWSPSPVSNFPHAEEMLRFFDYHLKGIATGIEQEKPVQYFTMGEERWHASESWPPTGFTPKKFYFSENHRLKEKYPTVSDASDHYDVDFESGTGDRARWNSPYNPGNKRIQYPDRKYADTKLLVYDSDPLEIPFEVTGHPVANLMLQSEASDGEVIVYLEDVAPNGEVLHVTEGELRLLHRAVAGVQPRYVFPGVPRTFEKAAAKEMSPREIEPIRFDLLPTSYLFRAGHKIRVALAGADRDHFARIPPSGPAPFRFYRDARNASLVELPGKWREDFSPSVDP